MKKIIGVVFSYEELNTNVFFNAILWQIMQKSDVEVIAYVPEGFSSLFFSIPNIIEIPSTFNNFKKYSEVSEYFPKKITSSLKFKIKARLKQIKKILLYKILINFRIRNQLMVSILNLIPSDRQKIYLFESGIWKWIRKDFSSRNQDKLPSIIFPAQNLIKFNKTDLIVDSSSLQESYRYLFKELYNGIENGLIDNFKNSEFCKYNKNLDSIFVLRTRNFKNKQKEHNTQTIQVFDLVLNLLENEFTVINIGNPALSLINEIPNLLLTNYSEFDNVLKLDEEVELLESTIISRADAGLFVLISCMPNPLICLSREWSEYLDISLLNARQNAGYSKDIILESGNEVNSINAYIATRSRE